MATTTTGALIVIFATFIGSAANLFFKIGSAGLSKKIMNMLKNRQLILGFILYGTSALFFVAGLKHGDLSVLYPLVFVGYIWTCLLAMKFLGEKMNATKWAGIAVIIAGVSLLGIGSGR